MAIPVAAAALIKFVLRFFCASGKTVFFYQKPIDKTCLMR